MDWLWMTAAGILAGTAGSLGLGGGSVLLLYLTLIAGAEQLTAQGINLIFFLPVAILALFLHRKNGYIAWKSAIPCALCGLAGAVAGSLIAGMLEAGLLRKIFGGVLVVIGLRELFYKKKKEENPQQK